MTWLWPRDTRAAKAIWYGRYGADFDEGIDRLIEMITRRDRDLIERCWSEPRAISYPEVAQCAKTLIALSDSTMFSVGVIAMVAALLPKSYLRELPGDVAEVRTKIMCQREKQLERGKT